MVRERRRVARILFVLAVIFALCWLPYNLLTLFLDLDIALDKFGLDQVFTIITSNYFCLNSYTYEIPIICNILNIFLNFFFRNI